jgi:hypothetical protein
LLRFQTSPATKPPSSAKMIPTEPKKGATTPLKLAAHSLAGEWNDSQFMTLPATP